ncbi:hypothetical protein EJB05_53492, partial [Eragrostis curvula]
MAICRWGKLGRRGKGYSAPGLGMAAAIPCHIGGSASAPAPFTSMDLRTTLSSSISKQQPASRPQQHHTQPQAAREAEAARAAPALSALAALAAQAATRARVQQRSLRHARPRAAPPRPRRSRAPPRRCSTKCPNAGEIYLSKDISIGKGLNRIDRILISTSCNFFSGSSSRKNSEVKRAWLGAMGDRPGSPSRVRTSEDKVRRKDMCWYVRSVLIPRELPGVRARPRGGGTLQVVSEPTLVVSRARVGAVAQAWCAWL